MKLRPYQSELIDQILDLPNDARTCVCAPTGAGKTVIFSEACSRYVVPAVWQPCQVLIVVHMDVLVKQTIAKLQSVGVYNIGIIAGRFKEDRRMAIQVASAQTLARRDWWKHQPWKMVILDEAHTTAFSKVGRWIMDNLEAKRIGFTATPYRLSKKEGMKTYFDSLLAAPVPHKLQEMGFLCKMRYFSLKTQQNLSGVRTSAGDYNSKDLSNQCQDPELIQAIIKDWKDKARGRRSLAFCVDVKHAIAVADAFNEAGIPAAMVSGEMSTGDRNDIYKKLEDGEILVLTSCMVVSIGFDSPSVSCLMLLRATKSKAIHFQQIGRGMRIAQGKKDCIVLDQTGNCKRLGLPESMRKFTLDEAKEVSGNAPMKECPICGEWHYGFVEVCSCGYRWPKEIRKERELEEMAIKKPKPKKFTLEEKRAIYADYIQQAYELGYTPGWSLYKYKEEVGSAPPFNWRAGSVPECSQRDYVEYLWDCGKGDRQWIQEEFFREYPGVHHKSLLFLHETLDKIEKRESRIAV